MAGNSCGHWHETCIEGFISPLTNWNLPLLLDTPISTSRTTLQPGSSKLEAGNAGERVSVQSGGGVQGLFSAVLLRNLPEVAPDAVEGAGATLEEDMAGNDLPVGTGTVLPLPMVASEVVQPEGLFGAVPDVTLLAGEPSADQDTDRVSAERGANTLPRLLPASAQFAQSPTQNILAAPEFAGGRPALMSGASQVAEPVPATGATISTDLSKMPTRDFDVPTPEHSSKAIGRLFNAPDLSNLAGQHDPLGDTPSVPTVQALRAFNLLPRTELKTDTHLSAEFDRPLRQEPAAGNLAALAKQTMSTKANSLVFDEGPKIVELPAPHTLAAGETTLAGTSSSLTSASQPTTPAPPTDLTAAIERIAEARRGGAADSLVLSVTHRDFGAIGVRLDPHGSSGGASAILTNSDAAFVPSIQAALTERSASERQQMAGEQSHNARGETGQRSEGGALANHSSSHQTPRRNSDAPASQPIGPVERSDRDGSGAPDNRADAETTRGPTRFA